MAVVEVSIRIKMIHNRSSSSVWLCLELENFDCNFSNGTDISIRRALPHFKLLLHVVIEAVPSNLKLFIRLNTINHRIWFHFRRKLFFEQNMIIRVECKRFGRIYHMIFPKTHRRNEKDKNYLLNFIFGVCIWDIQVEFSIVWIELQQNP